MEEEVVDAFFVHDLTAAIFTLVEVTLFYVERVLE